MTVREQLAGLFAAATLSLALVSPALAAPAGDEYLPRIPQSGAESSRGSSSGGSSDAAAAGTETTSLPTGESTSGAAPEAEESDSSDKEKKDGKDRKDRSQQVTPVGSSGSGGSDGGDSGSVLFSPIALLMIAAVIAAALGMTLRRRQPDGGDEGADRAPASEPGRRQSGPRTPEGEIVARRDRPA